MPNWVYLAGEIGKTIIVVGVTVAVLVLIGVISYHVKFSIDTLIGLVVYTVVGTASMCALALAGTRLCPTTDSATSLGPFATVVLAFISGVFIPAALLPPWLIDISRLFPLEHLAHGLQVAFVIPGSTGLSVQNIGVLVGWGVAGLVAACSHSGGSRSAPAVDGGTPAALTPAARRWSPSPLRGARTGHGPDATA